MTFLRSSDYRGQESNSEILTAEALLLALTLDCLTHTKKRIKFAGDLPFPTGEFVPRLVSSSIANNII